MSQKTIIGLVRHGVTAWNEEMRIQGHQDVPLNERGLKQARFLAQRLSKENWEVIISSDLHRALQTAEQIMAQVSNRDTIQFHTDRRLRERYFGRLENTTIVERIQQWGEHWELFEYEVEKEEAFMKRVRDVLRDTVNHYANQRILFVTHGGFVRRALKQLFPEQSHEIIDNCSITIVEYENQKWHCPLYNCTNHIQ